ncbi:MAG: hypothetical protein IJB13_04100 [Clostridia bacterium]|nr:hypothetical protein [Clostridia bacterium]
MNNSGQFAWQSQAKPYLNLIKTFCQRQKVYHNYSSGVADFIIHFSLKKADRGVTHGGFFMFLSIFMNWGD